MLQEKENCYKNKKNEKRDQHRWVKFLFLMIFLLKCFKDNLKNLKILLKLIQTDFVEIIAIFTKPDKPIGRKKILTPPIVKLTAGKYSIPVFQPHRLKDKQETIQKLNPDAYKEYLKLTNNKQHLNKKYANFLLNLEEVFLLYHLQVVRANLYSNNKK